MKWFLILVSLYFADRPPPATFAERWPDPFHEFGILPFPAPFQSDVPERRFYVMGSMGWISGRCGILIHRTLCIWDEAKI